MKSFSVFWFVGFLLVCAFCVNVTSQACVDREREAKLCPEWKSAGGCNHTDLMKIYCPKTCDLCKSPAPPIPAVPDCAKTQYGCCWDNRTVAKGPTNSLPLSACPPCLNRQSDTFCKGWIDDCSSKIQGQGDVMRLKCPQTCGVPCDYNLNINKCQDDPANRQNCIQWLADGKCVKEPKKMRVYCPSTCGLCPAS